MRNSLRTLSAFLVICMLFVLSVPLSAKEQKIVRVGYMDYSGFIEKKSDGSFAGYGAEYLQKISDETGYIYEYVYGTWSDLLAKLENHEIDLLCTAQYTPERAEMYDFSSYPIGYTQGLLYAAADNNICYEDFASFNGMKIGSIKNNEIYTIFKAYAAKHGFTYQLSEYNTEEQMLSALNTGEIDAMCSEHLANHSGLSLLAKFGADAFYLMSYKNNPYMDDINFALQEIKTDVDFEAELFHKYYDSSTAASAIQFTTEEKEFIKNCGTIKVGMNMAREPFSFYNQSTNTFSGINVDVMDEISKISGITFEYVPMTAGKTTPELLSSGEYDLVCGIEKNNFDTSATITATEQFLESAIVPVGRAGENINLNGKYTVAIPSSFQALQKTISDNYPNLTVTLYKDNRECLDALVNHEADIFIQNTHLLSQILQEPKYENLDIMPIEIMTEHTAIAMLKTMDPLLLSVINKSINAIDPGIISSSLIKHTFANPYKMSFSDMLYKFRVPIITVSFLVFICFALLIIIIVFRRRNELKLKKANTQLGESIMQAEHANNAKSQFLARMSHEIRTPMNAIVGLTEIAKHHSDEKEKTDDYLAKIDSSAKILLSIINDVLDMSAIESEKLKIAHNPFDFKALLSSVSTMYYTQCKNKKIHFDMLLSGVTEEFLIGDALRVNQILLNLLSNAYKFTPEDGSIKVIVSQDVRADGKIYFRFAVSDTGCGISEEMQTRIFKPFEQESASTALSHGGSGLGLSITKSLVEMMHGAIKVESRKGKGTTFTVDLPFDVDSQKSGDNNANFKNIRALIVDDDQNTLEYTSIVLDRIGVQFETACDGDNAVEILSNAYANGTGYDICFIDWKMPGQNGVEVTKKIRELYDQDTIIIIVSAYDLSEVEEEAKTAGANMFVPKPLFQSTVYNVLMTLSGGKYVKVAENEANYDFTGKRVLLVEDNELNREIATDLLEMVNLTVDCAANGQEAVDIFETSDTGKYDAILMDIQMPIMNGHDAARAIRKSAHPQAESIPIYAMTANAFTEDIAAAFSCGMNGHIAKPIDTAILYETLNNCFKEEN